MIYDQGKFGAFIHDIVFDYLILMRDTFRNDDDEFSDGFVRGVSEGYTILYEKLALFELMNDDMFGKLPTPDEWLAVGPASIEAIVGNRLDTM